MTTKKHSGGGRLWVMIPFLVLFVSLCSPAMGQAPNEKEKTPAKSLTMDPAENLRVLKEVKRGRPAPYVMPAPTDVVQPPAGDVRGQSSVSQPPTGGEQRESAAAGEAPRQGDLITMNFKDVDLHVLIKFMSDLTGRNFVIDPNLKGAMTILSPEKITAEEAYQVFLSVLDVHGFAAVPSGKVVKIIQAVDAKAKGLDTRVQDGTKVMGDGTVTRLLPLKHGEAADFAKFLAPLVPKTGLLVPYPESNTLILIDTQSNINRLMQIVEELDVPDNKGRIHLFDLENANAGKLATKLTQLFQTRKSGAAGGQETVKILADERTNSLIVMASSTVVVELRKMLEQLDTKIGRRQGNIRILNLQHAVAEDVAKVLTEIPGKGAGKGGEDKEGGKAKPPVLSKDVQIYPDKATNSLVIIAEPDEFEVLEDIIRQLDVPRTMVFVEALIIEVSASKSLDLGVEWRGADAFHGGFQEGSRGGVVLGGSPGASSVDALAAGVIPKGFAVGVLGKAINFGGVVFPSFGAFVRAVQSDSNFNIISTPQILTLDNAEAVIEVGQNIPFVTRVDQPSQVTERAIQTFEYKDVGVTLKVTPTINHNRFVMLKVEQSIKSVVERTALGGTVLAPTTTFRRAKTAITVSDGDTAVIGGLMENRMDRGNTQTPCLGGIPGLGWLFKSTNDRDEKTNLLVFLSPRIVGNPEEGRRLYEDKRTKIDSSIEEAVKKQESEKLRRMLLE